MRITLVVAVAENGVIGRDGGLPWRLSTDLKRYKATTMGKPVIMGRRTWESIPSPALPGRRNIVVTRNEGYEAPGADIVHGLDAALERAERAGAAEACVIGGGEIFVKALPIADRLDVTHVLAPIAGDAYFPPIDPAVWRVVSSHDVSAGEKDSHPTRHVVYVRTGETGR